VLGWQARTPMSCLYEILKFSSLVKLWSLFQVPKYFIELIPPLLKCMFSVSIVSGSLLSLTWVSPGPSSVADHEATFGSTGVCSAIKGSL
jgi:hypothetical protein